MTESNILPYEGQANLIDDHGAEFDWPAITRTLYHVWIKDGALAHHGRRSPALLGSSSAEDGPATALRVNLSFRHMIP